MIYDILYIINIFKDIIYKFFKQKRVSMVNLTVGEKNDLIEVYDCLLARNSFESFGKSFLNFIKRFSFLRR